MPIRKRISGEPPKRTLAPWYASEDAKRSLGFLCQAVNDQGETIGLLGSAKAPQLHLMDVKLHDGPVEEILSIDEAKANWSAVVLAAAVIGTRFQIDGRKKPRAVLIANPVAPHPARRFKPPQSPRKHEIAQRLEEILGEIRRLDNRLGAPAPRDLGELERLVSRLDRSSALIDRRFRDTWRSEHGYPPA